jgi:hypothetical protein
MIFYSLSIYIHPFGLYFLPAVLVILWDKLILAFFVIFNSISSYYIFSNQLYKCSDKRIIDFNNNFNIKPNDFLEKNYFEKVLKNLNFERLNLIISKIKISDDYNSSINYLPKSGLDNNVIFWISNGISVLLIYLTFILLPIYLFKILKKENTNQFKNNLYVLFLLIGVYIHLILNKTNAFYAVNFWYVILVIILANLIKDRFVINIKYRNILVCTFFVTGCLVSYSLLVPIKSHIGPNLNLYKNNYSRDYIKKIKKYFNDCCSTLKEEKYVIDDATYFMLKNKIKYPIPITYSEMYKNSNEIYDYWNINYIIVRCGNFKDIDSNIVIIDGGYGINNICFKKWKN